MSACPTRHPTVLVVEDHVSVRRRLCDMLATETPVQIVADVGSAREAIDAFERFRPDAVVLDLGLPDGSGVEVLRRIKASAPFCFVIVLTQFDEPIFAGLARAAGADCFFHKSTQFERVAAVLTELAQVPERSQP